MEIEELNISLEDTEWPYEYTSHDRTIARAIVYLKDDFYFVKVDRDDDFGKASYIETSGGGVDIDEALDLAIKRELSEELGVEVNIISKIGIVSDYYNKIHRHNINHYFLCEVKSFGNKHMTDDEINLWHLSTIKLKYEEALSLYEKNRDTKIGRLVANREVPVLKKAKEILDNIK